MSDLPLHRAGAKLARLSATTVAPAAPAGLLSVSVTWPAWFQVGLAWIVFVLLRHVTWDTLGLVFNDTDDAMRLLEVRDLLAGQSWFDLVQHRLDPAAPVPSHWSRLVDLPIAALIRGFGLVLPGAQAERLAMATWPVLTFLPVLAGLRAIAIRLAGPAAGGMAGLAALVLAVTCLKVTWQFFPGRIDHHNVQMALSIWLLAMLLRPGQRGASLAAGTLAGAMLAVGFETLPLIVVAAACYGLRFLVEDEARAEVAGFGLALAGSAMLLFLATTPVERYGIATCDALSISILGLACGGGLALAAAALVAGNGLRRRGVALALAAGFAAGLFAWIEPACLAGPFAQMDPALKPLWLDYVDEVQPISHVWAQSRLRALMAVVDPVLALAFAPLLLRVCKGPMWGRMRAPALAMVAAVALSFAIGLAQLRTLDYANLLAVPLLAAAVALLAERARQRGLSPLLALVAGLCFASSTTLAVFLSAVPDIQAPGEGERLASLAQRSTCYDSRIYAALAAEPKGLVLSFTDSGPFLLAATPHDVLAAPYHRNGHGILAAARAAWAGPAEAERRVRASGADILALCVQSGTLQRMRDESADTLAVRLAAGDVPPWLQPIPTGTPALLAYRVKPAR